VLTVGPEAGPGDGTSQGNRGHDEIRLLGNLTDRAADHVLARLHLAAQAVVLAVVDVVPAFVAVQHEYPRAVWGQDVDERGEDRRHHAPEYRPPGDVTAAERAGPAGFRAKSTVSAPEVAPGRVPAPAGHPRPCVSRWTG